MNKRKDSTKKFAPATRPATEEELHKAQSNWYTFDIHLENGSIETIEETSNTYEMVAAYYKATRGDKVKINKIERITDWREVGNG